ncbi:leucine-rich repeat domain-containing protein [Chryseolinea sp. T2]|uniref:leucine-rich repeat domain-containing protein n=1 Tax=Chryseolinea sp. T2 TaxID=3129255 RepID=UPI0030787F25
MPTASAQGRKILGRILDKEEQKPVRSATVILDGTASSTVTNYLGYFELSVDSSATAMTISHPEFNTVRIAIPLEDKFKLTLERKQKDSISIPELVPFYNHVRTELKYPAEARRMKIEGIVQVSFEVNTMGNTSNVKLMRDIGFECGREVVRTITSLPPSFGRMISEETSFTKFILRIHFGLGRDYHEPASDPIEQAEGVFILNPVFLTAMGIDRPNADTSTSQFNIIIGDDYYNSLTTALKHPKNAKRLSLVDQGYTKFPDEILQLSNLELLDLEKNKISVLPENINFLSKLQGLFLFDNQLKTLPMNITGLTKLRTLSVASNKLSVVPDAIFSLEKLEELDLSNNQIQTLPAAIQSLSNLRTLALNDNSIKTLPAEIFQLKKLQRLYIKGNPISAEELARIKSAMRKVEVTF